MDIRNAVTKRRSIRQYTNVIPKEEQIQQILEAAIWAPSGLNNQPWKFKVVKSDNRKKEMARFTKYGDIINDAPVIICVFLDNRAAYNRDKDIMAIGACIQNMLLQAYEIGLGTCWLGEILNRKKEVQKYLGTDPEHELMAIVTLGYANEKISAGRRKKLKSFLLV